MTKSIQKRKVNKTWYLVIIISIVAIIMLTMLEMIRNYSPPSESISDSKSNIFDDDKYSPEYAAETSYAGEPALPNILFSFPFGKTEKYMCNKAFIEKTGVENAEILSQKAVNISESLFSIAYKDSQETDNKKEFITEELADGLVMYMPDETEVHGKNSVSERVFEWMTDNKVSMESELITDKCMVFYDNYSVRVRGLLLFTVYECDDLDKLAEIFNLEKLEYGRENAVVIDFNFTSGESWKDCSSYKLQSLYVIS